MKILILTASPTRDTIVDELLAEELRKYGHEVTVKPCLREGRQAVIEARPDTVVVPPIRNPYSRDMVEVIKSWGIGVISRHTEPSCDKKDFEKMDNFRRTQIYGQYEYKVDAELVWSKDEAEILNGRPTEVKTYPVGAFTVDAYLREDIVAKYRNKPEFCAKHGFDVNKKILLICSPWGFADAAPDLHIEDIDDAKKDIAGRDRHFEMIRHLTKLKDSWNVLVSCHPGVVQKPYKDLCTELGIALDTESTGFYLKVNVDAIVHAGSTMAIGAHYLGIPCWQFGDVYAKNIDSWWGDPESPICKVSPYCKTPEELYQSIVSYQPGTNANTDALKALEEGRFGLMDGKATIRAAEIISKIKGEFKLSWPDGIRDYSQLTIQREERRLFTRMHCGICKKPFIIVNDSWLGQAAGLAMSRLKPYLKEMPPVEALDKLFAPPHSDACPHCSARFYRREAADE